MNRFQQFKKSFAHAARGLTYVVKHEKNFQTELVAALLVILAILWFEVTRAEMVVLLLVIAGVLVMELFNTVVERVVDILKPRVHPYARLIKDLMAASVLVASILALLVGILIFFPYIAEMF
ncbi:MAG TPA: diacylglycerol kinase family protein [Candidatus Moranbacteria bacterium]|mgnify:CR=1 FL=1|nr:diacylglycerol kinase family protein [Candidatus Moranbacteria bacterium]